MIGADQDQRDDPDEGALAVAGDIPAVRDLVGLQRTEVALTSYPSVQAAVDELTKRA